MNEDYLWDKSGNDQEIERLESVLSTLRYQPDKPPVLPGVIAVPVREKAGWWNLSLGFGFATCLAIVALVGVWLMFNSGVKQPAIDSVSVKTPDTIVERPPQSTSANTSDNRTHGIDKTDVTTRPEKTVFRSRTLRRPRRTLVTAKAQPQKDIFTDFTKEEVYAYRQLMMALSITGSKIKMVRETIAANED